MVRYRIIYFVKSRSEVGSGFKLYISSISNLCQLENGFSSNLRFLVQTR